MAARRRSPASLNEAVPGAFPDGVLDRDRLLGEVGLPDEASTTYAFSWAGRSAAELAATSPTTATLAPFPDLAAQWESTQHAVIEGDNLQAIKVLLRGLRNRIKLIYLDPPYNTGKTFTYNDDYAVLEAEYLRMTGQVDAAGQLQTTRRETTGRKHGPWMTMMSPALRSGSAFPSSGRRALRVDSDDNEVHHLRLLLDAVFGPDNRLGTLVWNRGHSQQQGVIKQYHEYVHVYAKNAHGFAPFGATADTDIIAGAMKADLSRQPGERIHVPSWRQVRGTRRNGNDWYVGPRRDGSGRAWNIPCR